MCLITQLNIKEKRDCAVNRAFVVARHCGCSLMCLDGVTLQVCSDMNLPVCLTSRCNVKLHLTRHLTLLSHCYTIAFHWHSGERLSPRPPAGFICQ